VPLGTGEGSNDSGALEDGSFTFAGISLLKSFMAVTLTILFASLSAEKAADSGDAVVICEAVGTLGIRVKTS
jgi:hypothetical protein